MKRISTLLIVITMLFGVVASVQAVTVCASGCQETSIREAASNNDYAGQDIFVRPGTYNEGSIRILR